MVLWTSAPILILFGLIVSGTIVLSEVSCLQEEILATKFRNTLTVYNSFRANSKNSRNSGWNERSRNNSRVSLPFRLLFSSSVFILICKCVFFLQSFCRHENDLIDVKLISLSLVLKIVEFNTIFSLGRF